MAMNLRFLSALKGRAARAPHAGEAGEKAPRNEGGKFYALWKLALPLLLGGTLGWFAAVCLGIALDRFAGGTAAQRRGALGTEVAKQETKSSAGLDAFLTANPFRTSPMVLSTESEVPEEKPDEVVVTGSLADAIVRGTLPDVGVWLEDKGQVHLVLVDTSFDVYTLAKVTYRGATFVRDDEVVVRELLYGPQTVRAAAKPVAARAVPADVPVGSVVPAKPGEQDGEIPSGLVNQLVQNPFDELKKVRLRPKDGEPGLQIQWIQNDSILKQLGVQKGDIIKGVNGIPFSNMADIANSINSLMNSERFDVEVTRKGKPTSLRYVVR
ncbi:MAG: hypothetical protein IJ702_08905 [Fretibacterium sp.]|nr:hypothetical protein [Fretibacterium sp.]